MNENNLIKRKMHDLADDSFNRNIWEYSKFLNIAEQSEVLNEKYPVSYFFLGGYENAERKIAVFGNYNDIGYDAHLPVEFIEISPLNKKFADDLTHRDFLGALMSLGIGREMIGDILVNEKSAVVICIDTVVDYIINELNNVKHTSVKCKIIDFVPADILPKFTIEEVIVSSERLDVIIAGVFNLSRKDSLLLFQSEKVFCNGSLVANPSFIPKTDSIISVRGFGRFIFADILRTTKKNKHVISIKKYSS